MKKKNPKSENFKLAAKSLIGLILVTYVLRSKMIDFSALGTLLRTPLNLAVAVGGCFFCAFCVTARWFILARAQGLSLSYRSTFEMTMIGNFFNTFMPGAVGGDVVKAWYVAGEEPTKKTRAVFTVLLDRVIGLSVFFLYSALTLLFYTSWLVGKPKLQVLATCIWAFSLTSVVAGLIFYTPFFWRLVSPQKCLDAVARWPFVHRVVEAALLYRHHVRIMALSVLLSAASIFGTILIFKWIGDSLGISVDIAHYMFIIPVAQTVSAIPLLPGGVGVGQVAFFTLFAWTGVAHPEQGGTLCTAFQVYTILFNCLGAFFYLKFKKRPRVIGTPTVSRPEGATAVRFSPT